MGVWPEARFAVSCTVPPSLIPADAVVDSVGDALVTETSWGTWATDEPLQLAVWPVKMNAVEQPASSVTVRVAV